MKNIFFLTLWLGVSTLAIAQELIVKDKITLQPLEGVYVKGNNTGSYLLTNSKGVVDIDSFANADSIQIQSIGYRSQVYSYTALQAMGFKLSLTESNTAADEVIVSASKFEENKKDVAQQVQVIKASELSFMNQQTTAEVLQQSGNVLVQKSQLGGGSPIIRGFEANKVLIVVDGVRMNNAIFRGGHLQNVLSMDNTILDRTEILFGPGSVVYGSDALGGVMHFYTKNPSLASSQQKVNFKTNAFARYATAYDEKTGHVDFNIGLKKIAFLSSITISDFGDLQQGSNRKSSYGDWGKRNFYVERINGKDSMVTNSDVNVQKQTGYRQYDFLQKVLFRQNENINHVLNFQYSTSGNVYRYDRLTEVNGGGIARSAQWYYGPQSRFLGSYRLNLKGDNLFYNKASVILAFQDVKESRHNRNFNSSNLNHRKEHVNVYSVNVDLEKTIKEKHELRYGAEFVYNTVNSKAERENIITGAKSDLDTRYPNGGSTMQTIAFYATHSWHITKKVVLNDGLRYSNINLHSSFGDKTFFPFPYNDITQKSHAVNGNLGLVYMPGADWRFTVLGSSGFRAPNVDDMAKVFESTGGRLVVPNPELKPEYTYNVELGASKTIAQRLRVEATGFYTWYINALTSQKTQFNGSDSIVYNGINSAVYHTTNAAEAYIYGLNVALYADITSNLSFSSTLNYTYGRIKTDSTDYPLDHIAPIFGKISLMYKMKKMKVEAFTLYNGDKLSKDFNLQGEDNQAYSLEPVNGKVPAWYTFNIRLAYQINDYLQAQVALENIMDTYYRVFASGISAPGRNAVFTLRARF
ncbi:MAG: TonB-dependent receptor [Cytophagaceae bacterium]|nr:TonB-dependent receptor [Cytophagaceae bacterium]